MSLPYIIAQTRLDSHAPSYMRPAGAPAGGEAVLGWALTIIAVAVTVVIAILLVVAVLRKREDPDSTTTRNASDGTYRVRLVPGLSWIYVGLAITVVILLGTFSATVVSLANSAHAPSRPKITMDIIAHQWWWEVRMEDTVPSDAFVTANEIHVPVGVPVEIRVQSQDVIHSFWVPELFGKMDVIPGQINVTWMRADRSGTAEDVRQMGGGAARHQRQFATAECSSAAERTSWRGHLRFHVQRMPRGSWDERAGASRTRSHSRREPPDHWRGTGRQHTGQSDAMGIRCAGDEAGSAHAQDGPPPRRRRRRRLLSHDASLTSARSTTWQQRSNRPSTPLSKQPGKHHRGSAGS